MAAAITATSRSFRAIAAVKHRAVPIANGRAAPVVNGRAIPVVNPPISIPLPVSPARPFDPHGLSRPHYRSLAFHGRTVPLANSPISIPLPVSPARPLDPHGLSRPHYRSLAFHGRARRLPAFRRPLRCPATGVTEPVWQLG
jgi:hypothetical protein